MGWSFGSRTCRISRLVSVLRSWQRKERDSSTDGSVARPWASRASSELCLYGSMVREVEDRASPILVGKFSKDRWLLTHPVPCKGTQHRWIVGKLVNDVIMSGVQTTVIKSDQEASILDVVSALTPRRSKLSLNCLFVGRNMN